ncbi:MAG TPA: DUF4180 domain-containing protein [Phenylobacterium sp.]|nr:DUF4180 domain-containing protein [Phenylobacterium sp.]
MSDAAQDLGGVRVLVCAPDGPPIGGERAVVDIIGQALGENAAWAVLPAERLGDDFFVLSTRIAGEAIQKFVNYGVKLTIVGDISRHTAASQALRDFVYESNRGRHVWFVDSLAELAARLAP